MAKVNTRKTPPSESTSKPSVDNAQPTEAKQGENKPSSKNEQPEELTASEKNTVHLSRILRRLRLLGEDIS